MNVDDLPALPHGHYPPSSLPGLHPCYWYLARLSLSLRLLPLCTERLHEGDGAVFSNLAPILSTDTSLKKVDLSEVSDGRRSDVHNWCTYHNPNTPPCRWPYQALAPFHRHIVSTRDRNVVVVPASFSRERRVRRERGNQTGSRTFLKLGSRLHIHGLNLTKE